MRYFFTFILSICSIILIAQNKSNTKIILNNNETIEGEILLQDEQTIVIRIADGSRYQFPVSDVKIIIQNSDNIIDKPATQTADNTSFPVRKIKLKSGEIYIGNVLVENEHVVIIQMKEGGRFQIPRNEILSIRDAKENDTDYARFTMMPDIQIGTSYSKASYQWVPELQISLLLGGIDLFTPSSFIGIGFGYQVVFLSNNYNNGQTISFLPLFLRFKSNITDKRIVPYIETNAGYSFALTDDFGGGMAFGASTGISLKVKTNSTFQVGIYGGLHSFSANLTEEKNFGTFEYYGRTTSKQLGIKVSINF